MNFYLEIIDPRDNKVLWHYYIKAPSAEKAKEVATNQFIKEQEDGLLIDTGGLFTVTVTEEK